MHGLNPTILLKKTPKKCSYKSIKQKMQKIAKNAQFSTKMQDYSTP